MGIEIIIEMPISDVLKPIDYYSDNKRKFNRVHNREWKRIAGPEYVGLCSYLFQAFYKEWSTTHKEYPTHSDFFFYYLSHASEDNHPSKYNGRTIGQLTELSKKYLEMCNDKSLTLEECFDDIINHVIIETFNGQMREILLCDEYERNGYSVQRTNGHWDKDLGVDLIIRNKSGKIVDYVQCKPLSTFLGDKNTSLVEDRRMFYRKEEDKKNECKRDNLPYYRTKFILYDEKHPGKWCKRGEKRSFYLEELCDREGLTKVRLTDFQY